MDGADKIRCGTNFQQGSARCPANPQFKYVDPSQVAPYFQLAEQYTFGDRMFQTNHGQQIFCVGKSRWAGSKRNWEFFEIRVYRLPPVCQLDWA
jgi:hypothetical protein